MYIKIGRTPKYAHEINVEKCYIQYITYVNAHKQINPIYSQVWKCRLEEYMPTPESGCLEGWNKVDGTEERIGETLILTVILLLLRQLS